MIPYKQTCHLFIFHTSFQKVWEKMSVTSRSSFSRMGFRRVVSKRVRRLGLTGVRIDDIMDT